MQFIAEDPVHVVIRNEIPALSDGMGNLVRDKRRRLYAKFARGVAPEWAREIGIARFEFRKLPGDITAEQWLAYYDSAEDQIVMGWNDEERQAIEQRLLTVDGVVPIEKPRLQPPWPAYDKLVAAKGETTEDEIAAKIAAKVEEDGWPADHVLAYEIENLGRPEVIAELQKLQPAPAPAAVYDQDSEELIEA